MKQILISGGNGFIGSHLIKRLVNHNYFVYALIQNRTDITEIMQLNNIKVIYFDLENIIQVINELPKDIDIFYHLAWNGVSTTVKNNEKIQIENISYGLNALKLAKELNIKKIIYTGSVSEFAYNNAPVKGDECPTPADFYSAVKVSTRYICNVYAKQNNLNFIWCLISSIYGPGREDNNLITYSIKSFLNGEKPSFTKLEQKWDYIYIDDLIEALYLIGKNGISNNIYTVGSGETKQLSEYVNMIKNKINPNLEIGIGDLSYKTGKIDNSTVDISLLKEHTGFIPKISFDDGIKKTIDYFINKKRSSNAI
jgi:nucleoside-diphosphate-sugar epimerase